MTVSNLKMIRLRIISCLNAVLVRSSTGRDVARAVQVDHEPDVPSPRGGSLAGPDPERAAETRHGPPTPGG